MWLYIYIYILVSDFIPRLYNLSIGCSVSHVHRSSWKERYNIAKWIGHQPMEPNSPQSGGGRPRPQYTLAYSCPLECLCGRHVVPEQSGHHSILPVWIHAHCDEHVHDDSGCLWHELLCVCSTQNGEYVLPTDAKQDGMPPCFHNRSGEPINNGTFIAR